MDIQEEADNIAKDAQEIQKLKHIVGLQRSVIQQKEQINLIMSFQIKALGEKLMEFYTSDPSKETFSEENEKLLKASITRIFALGDQTQAVYEELAALETQ